MGSLQDVADKERLLENGWGSPANPNNGKEFPQREATERRRCVRHAQHLLLFNVAVGLLLSLAVAFFCIRPGLGYPWMPYRLQRVSLLLFALELFLFFALPPMLLLWRVGSPVVLDFRADRDREFVSIIIVAVCEFICGICATAMSALSIYTGKRILASGAGNGLITLCAFGMVACLGFALLGNPKFYMAKRLRSRSMKHEAELSVTGSIMNMVVALSAGLSLGQCNIPGVKFSVLGAAEYPTMFLGALLLVKSLTHLVKELLQHRKAALRSTLARRD